MRSILSLDERARVNSSRCIWQPKPRTGQDRRQFPSATVLGWKCPDRNTPTLPGNRLFAVNRSLGNSRESPADITGNPSRVRSHTSQPWTLTRSLSTRYARRCDQKRIAWSLFSPLLHLGSHSQAILHASRDANQGLPWCQMASSGVTERSITVAEQPADPN